MNRILILLFSLSFSSLAISQQTPDLRCAGIPNEQSITADVDIEGNWQLANPLPNFVEYKTVISGALPNQASYTPSGSLRWKPDIVGTWQATISVICDGFVYSTIVKFYSKPKKDDPFGDVYNLKKECDASIASWRKLNCPECGNANANENQLPDLTSTPTDLYAQLTKMSVMSKLDLNNYPNWAMRVYGNKLSEHIEARIKQELPNYVLPPEIKNAIKVFSLYRKDAVSVVRVIENMDPINIYPGFFKSNILGDILFEAYYQKSSNGSVSSNSINLDILSFLDKKKQQLGLSEEDLYFLYLLLPQNGLLDVLFNLSTPEKVFRDIEAWKSAIIEKVNKLLEQKTTPGLACNNAMAGIASTRLRWSQLGMDNYNDYDYVAYLSPWLSEAMIQNVGQSMYENPEVWEMSKAVPIFGTAFAILDGALTLHSGVDLSGQSVDRIKVASMFAFDVASSAFAVYGASKSLTSYVNTAQRIKAFKNASSTDEIWDGLNKTSGLLRKELKFAKKNISELVPCQLGARAMLSSVATKDIFSSNDYAELLERAEVCRLSYQAFKDGQSASSGKNYAHQSRSFVDANMLTNLAYWKQQLEYNYGIDDIYEVIKRDLTSKGLSDEKVRELITSSIAYEQLAKKYAKPNIFITSATKDLTEELSTESKLVSFFELRDLKKTTDLTVMDVTGGFMDYKNEILPKIPGIKSYFESIDQLDSILSDVKFGFSESTKNNKTLRKRIRTNLAEAMFAYRAKLSPSESDIAPFIIFSDRKSALDAYKLGTGIDLLKGSDKKSDILDAYKELLELTAGEKVKLVFTNANFKSAGATIYEGYDYSNLTLETVFLPLNCAEAQIPKIESAFPELSRMMKKAFKKHLN